MSLMTENICQMYFSSFYISHLYCIYVFIDFTSDISLSFHISLLKINLFKIMGIIQYYKTIHILDICITITKIYFNRKSSSYVKLLLRKLQGTKICCRKI